ncbi:MAG: hypothetical protein ACP5HS_11720 [Anaerolineae bacterium]
MRDTIRNAGPYLVSGARTILWMFLVLAAVVFAIQAARALSYPYPLDYGEGPLLDQAMRLSRWENIYPHDLSSPPFTISNYPPLYVALLAPVVGLFGPHLVFGRALSVVAALAAALFIGLIIETNTGRRLAAWASGLSFLVFPYTAQWAPLMRVDLVALALSLAGLYVISRWHDARFGLVGTAALLIAAAYTKQSYALVGPLAAFVWVWHKLGWRTALKLAGMVAIPGVLLFLLLTLTTRGGFFLNVITANANAFDVNVVVDRALSLLETAPVMIFLAGLVLFLGLGNIPLAPLLVPYLVGSLATAATIGKVGSNVNYLLELAASLSLCGGAVLSWSHLKSTHETSEPPTLWRAPVYAAVAVAVAVQIGLLTRATLTGPAEQVKWRTKTKTELDHLARTIERAQGPVIADEYMALIPLQGRRLYLQPFEMTQLAESGHWDQTPLLEQIQAQTFTAIMIHHFPDTAVYRTRWTPEMLASIEANYIASRYAADTITFEPRLPGEIYPSSSVQCPGAVWALPSKATFGVWWFTKELVLMGEGEEGTVPVYAVADGVLMRRETWNDAVAIRHDDPLCSDGQVWTFYRGLASAEGDRSYVADEFPPGINEIPVSAGQMLGYQGRLWDSGSSWVHVRFAVLPSLEDGAFPGALVGRAVPDAPPLPVEVVQEGLRDPTLYLGTMRSHVMGVLTWLPPQCGTER